MSISAESYRQIGRRAAGAVSVVTAMERDGKGIVGLTVSSFVTLSFDPPLVMFAIQHDTNSYPAIVASKAFGVSLLSDRQADVARLFAVKGTDKIVNTRFESGTTLQVPLIAGALAQIQCLTSQIFISGDHAIVVGRVEAACTSEGSPLLYFAREFGTFAPLPKD